MAVRRTYRDVEASADAVWAAVISDLLEDHDADSRVDAEGIEEYEIGDDEHRLTIRVDHRERVVTSRARGVPIEMRTAVGASSKVGVTRLRCELRTTNPAAGGAARTVGRTMMKSMVAEFADELALDVRRNLGLRPPDTEEGVSVTESVRSTVRHRIGDDRRHDLWAAPDDVVLARLTQDGRTRAFGAALATVAGILIFARARPLVADVVPGRDLEFIGIMTVFALIVTVWGPVARTWRLWRSTRRSARALDVHRVHIALRPAPPRSWVRGLVQVWEGDPVGRPSAVHEVDISLDPRTDGRPVEATVRGGPHPLALYRPVDGPPVLAAGRVNFFWRVITRPPDTDGHDLRWERLFLARSVLHETGKRLVLLVSLPAMAVGIVLFA